VEKRLPLTAAIIESIAAGIGAYLFVRGASNSAILILASAALVILITLVLGKNLRTVAVAYLAGLALTLNAEGRTQEFEIVRLFLIVIVAIELGLYIALFSTRQMNRAMAPFALNGTFAFIGIIAGSLLRPNICPGANLEDPTARYFLFLSPVCSSSGLLNARAIYESPPGLLALSYLTWPPLLAIILAAVSETLRHAQRISLSLLLWWFLYFMKTLIVFAVAWLLMGALLMLILIAALPAVLPPELNNMPASVFMASQQFNQFIWFLLAFFGLLTAFLSGWAAAWKSSR
jgi:hypothetical protein